MYLSRLILNPRTRRVQRELVEPYEMHRSVMRALPQDLDCADERVLWRVDEHPSLGLVLLVQTRNEPDWSWIATEKGTSGYLATTTEPNPAVKPFDLNLQAGQVLTFRLRANPTKRLSAPEGHTGKRIGIYTEKEQVAWLTRKGELHGFSVLQVQVRDDGKVKNENAIHRNDVSHKLELLGVQFDGILRVDDPTLLVQGVQDGIGSAKAFGFGLLSLALARG